MEIFLVVVLTPVLLLDAFYNKPLDIISTNFGEFKDDSKMIYVTMLNVTEDVAMISHKEILLHLSKSGGNTVSEIILVGFPFSSVRGSKKIIYYLK